MSMASHLASLWKWDFLELGNGLLRALYDACSVANIPRGVVGTWVNPDACRIRLDEQIRFEYG